jgi:hypothetical protein
MNAHDVPMPIPGALTIYYGTLDGPPGNQSYSVLGQFRADDDLRGSANALQHTKAAVQGRYAGAIAANETGRVVIVQALRANGRRVPLAVVLPEVV